jgi:DNA-binding response OmpR family regulator
MRRLALAMENKTILVVDDEPFILRSILYVLKREGFKTLSATDGVEALELLREVKPSLMFLDVMMPRMNGYEVCTAIKNDARLKGIYVIMLTAKGQEQDRIRGLAAGADEYLTKPFSPAYLVERVRLALEDMGPHNA